MITSLNGRFLTGALMISLLGASTKTEAINLNSKMVWLGASIVALSIYWKNKKPVAPSEEESLLKSLKKARTLAEFIEIFERWVLGHSGKSASIKLKADNRTRFAHELVVTMEKGIPAYGLCGVTWSYLKGIYESLKLIKDLNETAHHFEITE